MDIDTITEDVAKYNDNLFKNTMSVIEDGFEFMDENELMDPKDNYIFVFNFLNTTIKHFTNLDYTFIDGTLKKLHRDVNNIHKLYEILNNSLGNIEKFKSKFLKNVKVLKEIQDYNITRGVKSTHYDDMYALYDIYYERDYIEQSKYIINSIKTILNSKIYYLDKLLWMDAVKSEHIYRFLKMLKINVTEGIDSKKYIQHKQKVDLPYTEDYAYLTKCLRIYK